MRHITVKYLSTRFHLIVLYLEVDDEKLAQQLQDEEDEGNRKTRRVRKTSTVRLTRCCALVLRPRAAESRDSKPL